MFLTSSTATFALSAIMLSARLWSSLVKAVKFCFGMVGAKCDAIKAFVLAGFPTTHTLTVFFATLFSASPYAWKIFALALSRSPRSIPGPRGLAPTKTATSASLKPTRGSVVAII